MDIKTNITGNRVEYVLTGKLDTASAPDFEEETKVLPAGISEVVLDLGNVTYVSSAGLRAILALMQRLEETDGAMYVKNVPQAVQDVFEVTGFDMLLPRL